MTTLGNLTPSSTVFFCCDMQERFRPAIKYFGDIISVGQRLVCWLFSIVVSFDDIFKSLCKASLQMIQFQIITVSLLLSFFNNFFLSLSYWSPYSSKVRGS